MELTEQINAAAAALDATPDPATIWRGFDLAWHATSCLIDAPVGAGLGWLSVTTALIDTPDALDQLVQRHAPALRPDERVTASAELRAATASLLTTMRSALLTAPAPHTSPSAAAARLRAADALAEAGGALQ